MENWFGLDLLLAMVASIAAFFVSTSARQHSRRMSAAAAMTVSIGLFALDRVLFVSTGTGLLDNLTCLAWRSGVSCLKLESQRPTQADVESMKKPIEHFALAPRPVKAQPSTDPQQKKEQMIRITGVWAFDHGGRHRLMDSNALLVAPNELRFSVDYRGADPDLRIVLSVSHEEGEVVDCAASSPLPQGTASCVARHWPGPGSYILVAMLDGKSLKAYRFSVMEPQRSPTLAARLESVPQDATGGDGNHTVGLPATSLMRTPLAKSAPGAAQVGTVKCVLEDNSVEHVSQDECDNNNGMSVH